MARKEFNFALVGGGMYGEEYLRTFRLFPQAQVRWIVSRSPDTVARIQRQYDIPHGTTSLELMLSDPAVDAVVICSPPYAHASQFISSVEAGKNVILEKPMAVNRAEMEQIVAAARLHPELVLCEASARHTRLQPKFTAIRQIIDSGALGEVYHIHHQSVSRQNRPGIEYNPAGKWFLNRELAGGGPLADWGEYDLSFHLGLLHDRPQLKQVHAFTQHGMDNVSPDAHFDVEEHFGAFMEFDTGLTFYYEKGSNAHVPVPNETRIYGTRGGLKFSYLTWSEHQCIHYTVDTDGVSPLEKTINLDISDHPGDNAALVAHYLDALEGLITVAMPVSLAAKHFDIILRTYAASEINRSAI